MITTGQGTAGPTAVTLCVMPPGPCLVLVSNAGTASPVYVGAGATVTTTNGFPVPSGAPVAFNGFQGSQGSKLSVICSAGSAAIGFMISTATGQTGI